MNATRHTIAKLLGFDVLYPSLTQWDHLEQQ
jgi:hypothetical protein